MATTHEKDYVAVFDGFVERQRWRTAIHEAGHVAVGVWLGYGAGDALVAMKGGQAMAARGMPCEADVEDLLFTLAGRAAEPLAERHPRPERPRPTTKQNRDELTTLDEANAKAVEETGRPTPTDDHRVRIVAGGIFTDDARDAALASLRNVAGRIIEQWESRVVEAARSLYLHGTLGAADAAAIFGDTN